MNEKNRLTDHLFLFDIVNIFSLTIPIVLTGSSPDISNPAEYKKAINGLKDVFKITPSKRFIPIGFGASMKRPGIKNKNLFTENFLTIGDNLTVAAMIESIKLKIHQHGVSVADESVSILVTGPTGFIGSELMSWILDNTCWKIIAKSSNKARFDQQYLAHPQFSRVQCLASFDDLTRIHPHVIILATHLDGSIPPISILQGMSDDSLILDVCTPNVYTADELKEYKGRYYSSIAVEMDELHWTLGNNTAVGHRSNTIWPCFCELALAIKENINGFSREELLDVSLINVDRMHKMALSNRMEYCFNIEV
ncbi:hypothetical protein P4S72_00450 [Vibrio sp. PP-XX7]